MIRKSIVFTALVVVSAFALAGCGSDVPPDPYLEVSLHEAFYGPPPASKAFKYKIKGVEVVEAVQHLALVREGNVTEFIAGRSIADKMQGKSDITFNCQKKYTPYPHMRCEELIADNDTTYLTAAGAILYPRITPAGEFSSRDHEEINLLNLRYDRSEQLTRFEEKQFEVTVPFEWDDEEGAWVLVGPRARMRVENPNDYTEMVLRLLAKEGGDFRGGITFTAIEEWTDRQHNQIAGTVTIDYITYLGRVFHG